MEQTSVSRTNKFKSIWISALHLLTLWGFAVAQPLYDLLAKFPMFFVAHDCTRMDIISFVFVIGLLLPGLFILAEFLLGLFSEKASQILHYLLVCVLTGIIFLPLIKKANLHADWLTLGIAIIAGLSFVLCYWRSSLARKILTVCSFAVLVFPVVFVFGTPVRQLVFPSRVVTEKEVSINNRVPVVVVLFDEIATHYLLDENGNIDRVRYPNFAKLSQEGNWYRNALSVGDATYQAVPAILTGSYFQQKEKGEKVPALQDYPNNLFTLLGNAYDLNVLESSTQLCPEQFRAKTPFAKRVTSLYSDSWLVYLQIVAPRKFAATLPDVTGNWEDLATARGRKKKKPDVNAPFKGDWMKFVLANLEGRADLFRGFTAKIRKTEKPQLNLIDICLPHPMSEYFPSGISYSGPSKIGRTVEQWTGSDWDVTVEFQRYLLQLGFVDKLLGELLAELRSQGIYDEALIVVSADHGASYRAGDNRRELTSSNVADLVSVPLLIKLPHQKMGRTDERHVQTIDILPTIAEVLGIQLPWKVDGHSVLDQAYPERSEQRIYSNKARKEFVYQIAEIDKKGRESWQRNISLFGSGQTRPNGLFSFGPHSELIGSRLDQMSFSKDGPFSVVINQQAQFADVDLTQGTVRAFVEGKIAGAAIPPKEVAIALNGKICATTKVNNGIFYALLPDNSFINGRNVVDVIAFSPDMKGKMYLLHNENSVDAYSIIDRAVYNTNKHKSFTIDSTSMSGRIEKISDSKNGKMVIVEGWAADVLRNRSPDVILAFLDGKCYSVGQTSIPRPDVVKAFNKNGITHSGYRIELPMQLLKNAKDLRVIALSSDNAYDITTQNAEFLKLSQLAGSLERVNKIKNIDEYSIVDRAVYNKNMKKSFAIDLTRLSGRIEKISDSKDGKMVIIEGWAADVLQNRSFEAILAFHDGKSIFVGQANIPRPDIVKAFNKNGLTKSGYRLELPAQLWKNAKDLRVVALSGEAAYDITAQNAEFLKLPQLSGSSGRKVK